MQGWNAGLAWGGRGERLFTIPHLIVLLQLPFPFLGNAQQGTSVLPVRSRHVIPHGEAAGKPDGAVEYTEEGNLLLFLGGECSV